MQVAKWGVNTTDNDDLAMGMADAVQGHKVIELYLEHCVDVPNIIDDVRDFTQSVAAVGRVGCDASFDDVVKGYDCDMDEGDDINISDNSKDLSGSDDDAFDKLVKGPVDSGPTSKEQDSNMVTGSNAKIVTGLSDNDQPYEFEVLLSMDDDDDNNAIPPYPAFIPPTNPKHTYFVKGMLFISLEQFKNAVTDYAVYGGWGIWFKKNDKVRVRAVCQDGCKWIAYVAKMRDQMTFQMRTYYGRHTCTRTFKNMRCTSKWLGKTLVGELSDHPNMTSSTIVKGA